MKKQGYLDEFVYYLFFCQRDEPYLDKWVHKRRKAVSEFLVWSDAYRFREREP